MEHKIITGGEQYLPFARSRIKALKATGLKYASQEFSVDGAEIQVRISGKHDYIDITGDNPDYQFFTTGPAVQAVRLGGFNVLKGYALSARHAGVDTLGAPLLKAKKRGNSLTGATPPLGLDRTFPVKVHQIQGIREHTFFPQGAAGALSTTRLVNSWSSGRQIAGLSAYGDDWEPDFKKPSVDVEYDAAPVLGAKETAPNADWYKRAAVRTVSHPEFGTRRFVILTDIGNTFHIYPAAVDTSAGLDDAALNDLTRYSAQQIKTNVRSNLVRKMKAPLPAWCRQPASEARALWQGSDLSAQDYVTAIPQYRWAFNSAATQACSVVFEDLPQFVTGAGPATFLSDAGTALPLHEALPGLVELDIGIVITGANADDFTASVSFSREMRPSVTDKYIIGADYAWPVTGAALDDLILMTGSVYHESLSRQAAVFQDLQVNKSFIDVENQTASTVLRRFMVQRSNENYVSPITTRHQFTHPEPKYKRATAIVMAYDLRVLAFVVRQRYDEFAVSYTSSAPTSEIVISRDCVTAMRIQTYMRNALVDEVVMEPQGSAVDAALVSFFADSAVTGLYRMPVNERGNVVQRVPPPAGSPVNTYWSLNLSNVFGLTPKRYSPYLGSSPDPLADVSAGACIYAKFIARSMRVIKDQFAVHPDGSWSIETVPVVYFSGPVIPGTDPLWADFAIGASFDAGRMRVARIDLVRYRRKKDGVELKTTHLALLNQALGTAYTAADFLPAFEKRILAQTVGGVDRVSTFLTDANSTRTYTLEQRFVVAGSYNTNLARPYQFDFQTESYGLWALYAGTGDTIDKTSVLGGSAIFL